MRLRPEQLSEHLSTRLAPIYLIAGDEPLQRMEAADAVRAHARAAGFAERERLDADGAFDWQRLAGAADELSLFAERRLIDLRLLSGKPGTEGGRALQAYAERAPQDRVLLIESGRLPKGAQQSAWLRALEAGGVVVQVYPLGHRETVVWLERRLGRNGLSADREALSLLADRLEGNLLAAAQEVDRLALLRPGEALDADAVRAAVADSARYDVFDLAGAAMAGDAARAGHVLNGLRAEGIEPTLVLWALASDIRALCKLARQAEAGASWEQLLGAYPKRRRSGLQRALSRHNARRWRTLLARCARVDRVIKGQAEGEAWDELLQLVMAVCDREAVSSRCG